MMPEIPPWLALFAAPGVLGVLLATLLSVLFLPALDALRRLAPPARFRLLVALAALPAFGGLLSLTLSFAPSALDAAGLLRDHCAGHPGHAFHLCFVHGTPPQALWPLVGGAILLALALGAVAREVFGWDRARRWGTQLRAVGRYDAAEDCWLLDAEGIALTLGTVRPEVFVSARLVDQLGPTQWRAVLVHEQAHRQRRDALFKALARVLASVHLPVVRARLLAELNAASEQACDEAAAAATGSRTDVASAIVAMARLHQHSSLRHAEAFGAHAIEGRVRALLDGPSVRIPAAIAPLTAAAAFAALIVLAQSYESIHHDLETALTHFF